MNCTFLLREKKLLVGSDDYGRELTSVQNLRKKHKRLEAELTTHEPAIQVTCYRFMHLLSYFRTALFKDWTIQCEYFCTHAFESTGRTRGWGQADWGLWYQHCRYYGSIETAGWELGGTQRNDCKQVLRFIKIIIGLCFIRHSIAECSAFYIH